MVLPSYAPESGMHLRRTDTTLSKALARAFRWKRMLEAGEFATVGKLANHEEITPSYVTRNLQLTRLAPDLIEAILWKAALITDGRRAQANPARRLG